MMKQIILMLVISALCLPAAPVPGVLIPIGGGYSDIYAGFSEAAIANAHDGQVKILVLPSAYSTHPTAITEAERQTNMRDAEERRFQIEEACRRAAPANLTCQAVLAPIFVRQDAENAENLSLFTSDLSAIFILGGDQTVAMQMIAGTALESRLTDLNQHGVILAGTSAGGGMLSAAMLAGYNSNYAAGNALNFGAVDVWNSTDKHGLKPGIQSAILDQHFFQRGRLPRLLNAIALPNVPHIGVGVDAYTGVVAENEVLRDVFGLYTITILDAETYHAADAVKYVEAGDGQPPFLSLRHILVTLLSPGDFSYDLVSRSARLGEELVEPTASIKRDFEALRTPQGAGALFLSGGTAQTMAANQPVFDEFASLAGSAQGQIVLISIGYSNETSASNALDAYAKILPGQTTKIVLKNNLATPISLPASTTGIFLTGKDPSKVEIAALQPVRDAWLSGIPVFADNAAAGLVGAYFSAHGPISQDADEQELATQKAFRLGKTAVQPGLGLMDAAFESQLMDNNRWGRLFSLAYGHPDKLALGLSEGTILKISSDGSLVVGTNPLICLDLRQARLALGKNDGFVIANGLLDVYAPGESIQSAAAEIDARVDRAPTPVLPTAAPVEKIMPSPSPSVFVHSTPTDSPAPSVTPGLLNPSANPEIVSLPGVLLIGLLLLLSAILVFILLKEKGRKLLG